MIPRHQTILFALLLVASLAMGAALWHLRERAHQRLLAGQDSAPTSAPAVAPAEQAVLLVANDSDGSILTQLHSLPLPADPGACARAVLGKLLDLYAAPDAAHPVPGGASSVTQVFLLPAPEIAGAVPAAAKPNISDSRVVVNLSRANTPASSPRDAPQTGPLLAVVNLSSSFAANHPSGIETEMLTVLSICGTLHANLPRVTQVRFLVDGRERATLAGHADLTRTYLAGNVVPSDRAHP
ncbi:MAG: GerMN domain-containing protein [Terracidiphilus sp.]